VPIAPAQFQGDTCAQTLTPDAVDAGEEVITFEQRNRLMKMFHFAALLGMLLPAAMAAQTASAAVISYEAFLSGPASSPPVASPGIGTAFVDLDTTLNTMHVNIVFSGLLGTTTASHIHSATTVPFAGNAGVATTVPSFTGFPLGVTAGTYDQTLDMTLASSYNPSYVTANGGTPASAEAALFSSIGAGTAYLNIHTNLFPGGEIRGFFTQVPEPSTWALIALSAAGVAFAARRRCG
jgi:hypothetical protein